MLAREMSWGTIVMNIKYVLTAILLTGLMVGGVYASDGDWLEFNTDRPGSDYRDFDLPGGPGTDAGLKVCMVACEEDARCVAFTYVRSGVQGPNPRCWLKDSIPETVADDCCTSWVKGGTAGASHRRSDRAPAAGTISLRPGINFQGSDYRDFAMAPGATPEMCAQECQGDAQCRAFTYNQPGRYGNTAHCWLKNSVPQAYSDAVCVSGVKE
jgi:hypothetical protein